MNILEFVAKCGFPADNIIRLMRQRRVRRRVEEPSTSSSSGTQTEQPPPRISTITRRVATRYSSSQANNGDGSAPPVNRVRFNLAPTVNIDRPSTTDRFNDALQRRMERLSQARLTARRARPTRVTPVEPSQSLNNRPPSNDIHRVASSLSYSDLLDNPLGPTTRFRSSRLEGWNVDLTNGPEPMDSVDIPSSDDDSSTDSEVSAISFAISSSFELPQTESSTESMDDEAPLAASTSSSGHEE
jgi:hypothetical protein